MAKQSKPTFHILHRCGHTIATEPMKGENIMLTNEVLLPPEAYSAECPAGGSCDICPISGKCPKLHELRTAEERGEVGLLPAMYHGPKTNPQGAQGGYDDSEQLLPPGVV